MHNTEHVTLHLTNKCNQFCRHCWVDASFSDDLPIIPFEKMLGVVDDIGALGISSIKLTGGEPFLYPGIEKLIPYITNKGIKITIETNAELLTEHLIKILKEAGCYLAVSLDGYEEVYHDWFRQRAGCYSETMRNIELVVKNGISMQVIWSVCKENVSDIEQMLDLCTYKHINTIKINPVNLSGRAQRLNDITILSSKERVDLNEIVNEMRRKYPNIHIGYPMPPAFMSISEQTLYASECDINRKCTIFCNGDVGFCGGIEKFDGTFTYGNINQKSLIDILSDPIRHSACSAISQELTGVCAKCIHASHCKGYCKASSFFITGDIHSPYFLCQDMYESGRFPGKRLKHGSTFDKS